MQRLVSNEDVYNLLDKMRTDYKKVDAFIRLMRVQIDSAERDDAVYVDENGKTWVAPSAFAYYQICKALDEAKRRIAELEDCSVPDT